MGDKQKAKIQTLATHDTSCHVPIQDIKNAIAAILALNLQIIPQVGHAAADHPLQANKNPHFAKINIARVNLNKIFPLYQAAIDDFDKFVKKKEGRMLFKSTLDQAKTALAHYRDQLKDYKDLVADSVKVS